MRRTLLILAILVLVAQLVQPDREVPEVDTRRDMLVMTNAPDDIRQLVVGACYDCHSYGTDHPWYAYVTPVNFIVQHHVNEGREHLNFSLWDIYSGSDDAGEAAEVLQEGEMPPGYYRLMHAHGRLSDAERESLATWFSMNMKGGGEDAGHARHDAE